MHKILTKLLNQKECSKCARYYHNIRPKENPLSARDTDETIKRLTILRMREILTKQLREGQHLECARYQQNIYKEENPQSAHDTNKQVKGRESLQWPRH